MLTFWACKNKKGKQLLDRRSNTNQSMEIRLHVLKTNVKYGMWKTSVHLIVYRFRQETAVGTVKSTRTCWLLEVFKLKLNVTVFCALTSCYLPALNSEAKFNFFRLANVDVTKGPFNIVNVIYFDPYYLKTWISYYCII